MSSEDKTIFDILVDNLDDELFNLGNTGNLDVVNTWRTGRQTRLETVDDLTADTDAFLNEVRYGTGGRNGTTQLEVSRYQHAISIAIELVGLVRSGRVPGSWQLVNHGTDWSPTYEKEQVTKGIGFNSPWSQGKTRTAPHIETLLRQRTALHELREEVRKVDEIWETRSSQYVGRAKDSMGRREAELTSTLSSAQELIGSLDQAVRSNYNDDGWLDTPARTLRLREGFNYGLLFAALGRRDVELAREVRSRAGYGARTLERIEADKGTEYKIINVEIEKGISSLRQRATTMEEKANRALEGDKLFNGGLTDETDVNKTILSSLEAVMGLRKVFEPVNAYATALTTLNRHLSNAKFGQAGTLFERTTTVDIAARQEQARELITGIDGTRYHQAYVHFSEKLDNLDTFEGKTRAVATTYSSKCGSYQREVAGYLDLTRISRVSDLQSKAKGVRTLLTNIDGARTFGARCSLVDVPVVEAQEVPEGLLVESTSNAIISAVQYSQLEELASVLEDAHSLLSVASSMTDMQLKRYQATFEGKMEGAERSLSRWSHKDRDFKYKIGVAKEAYDKIQATNTAAGALAVLEPDRKDARVRHLFEAAKQQQTEAVALDETQVARYQILIGYKENPSSYPQDKELAAEFNQEVSRARDAINQRKSPTDGAFRRAVDQAQRYFDETRTLMQQDRTDLPSGLEASVTDHLRFANYSARPSTYPDGPELMPTLEKDVVEAEQKLGHFSPRHHYFTQVVERIGAYLPRARALLEQGDNGVNVEDLRALVDKVETLEGYIRDPGTYVKPASSREIVQFRQQMRMVGNELEGYGPNDELFQRKLISAEAMIESAGPGLPEDLVAKCRQYREFVSEPDKYVESEVFPNARPGW